MKITDRLALSVVGALVVVAAVWLLLVSPERSKVSSLSSQIATQQSALSVAEQALGSARAKAAGYRDDVHAIGQVRTAVPPTYDEPALITTITKLAGTQVDVHDLTVGSPAGVASDLTGLGLTFTFKATYGSLVSFVDALDRLTITDGTNIRANGRLFTIDSISLQQLPPNKTTATIIAGAYSQGTSSTGATGGTGATGVTTAAPATGATR